MTKNLGQSTTKATSGGGRWTLLAVADEVETRSFDVKDAALDYVRSEIVEGMNRCGAPWSVTKELIDEVLGDLDERGVWRDDDGPMVIYLFEGGS